MKSRTVAMDQDPSSALDGGIDKRLSPINEQNPFNRMQADDVERERRMCSRWEISNEILFLRVREIYDHVFEGIREPWLD